MTRTWQAWATVARNLDGDTFDCEHIDLGWGCHLRPVSRTAPGHCRIRVLYPGGKPFDAWEIRGPQRPLGERAAARTAELAPPGAAMRIESYGFDNFGRTLASVMLPDGRDLAITLYAEGHARADPDQRS